MSKPHLFKWTDVLRILKSVISDKPKDFKQLQSILYYSKRMLETVKDNLWSSLDEGTFKISQASSKVIDHQINSLMYLVIDLAYEYKGNELARLNFFPTTCNKIKRDFRYVEAEKMIEAVKRAYAAGKFIGEDKATRKLILEISKAVIEAAVKPLLKAGDYAKVLLPAPKDIKLLPPP